MLTFLARLLRPSLWEVCERDAAGAQRPVSYAPMRRRDARSYMDRYADAPKGTYSLRRVQP